MSINGRRWQVTAEHSCGQDTGHPCRIGAVDDPADLLDETITAGDYGRTWPVQNPGGTA